ncbi:CDP-alcohol phosphatidyltransferase family protein [Nocardiopsis sp. RSe5-2]|uniref:CDP-alcohol phosphatidyltransferase family protein n=1 Tax=Nocardiopsis endophytica TaxID=3018445 RepID=A0ABT4U5N0_9ACTN|nr:CDP-alcohol phosphatidyltransferase family protein [Nocardiopsis endophytica]MDA2812257.1 CDP-alcohol phosphatidyltransferase family protein [Nocardiopsis endophytica]
MPFDGFTLADVRERTYKKRDSWWTVYLVDPVASRLVLFTANRTSVTPDHLTIAALLLGCAAAFSFGRADVLGLVLGAVVFHISFLLDCMDGKIARLKGNGTVFGSWLDYVFDRVRVLICTIGLLGGQFAATGDTVYIWFALAVVFTDMFRYLNSPQMAKVRKKMRRAQKARVRRGLTEAEIEEEAFIRVLGEKRFGELRPRFLDEAADDAADDAADAADEGAGGAAHGDGASRLAYVPEEPPSGSLAERFPAYARFRDALLRHRVRPHLFSGIEFQMGVFIVAPLVGAFFPGAMLWVVGASCAGLMFFELFIVGRLWQASRRYEREAVVLDELVLSAAPEGAGPPEAGRAGEKAAA